MSKEKQIKSTDWLTRGIPKEQIEREKQEAILSADLELCHTEFRDGEKFYTDYDATAKKMFNIGYRKQSEWEWETIPYYKSDTLNAYSHICKVEGCGYFYTDFRPQGYKFCPNCGAHMRKEDEGK